MPRKPKAETQGGAVVTGNVTTGGGTFVGRDQIILLSGYTGEQLELALTHLRQMLASGDASRKLDTANNRLIVRAENAPEIVLSAEAARDLLPAAARLEGERGYLAALQVNPRYASWETQFVPLAAEMTALEQMEILPPEFILLEAVGEGPQRQITRTELPDVTQAFQRHPCLALTGEPGAGKTTTLRKLALTAARERLQTGQGFLPVEIPLASYKGEPSPFDFVQTQARQWLGAGFDLTTALRQGQMLILFDALNEMPFTSQAEYSAKVNDLREFSASWPGNRMVFSCRSRDYSEKLGLPEVEIRRLDDVRVQDFLSRYLAAEQAQQAWVHLQDKPILDLVRNPYYLLMLTTLIHRRQAWPESRAQLFRGFVSVLLEREKHRNHPGWPGEQALQDALTALAVVMQPMGQGTRLPRAETLAAFPAEQAENLLHIGLSATLLDTTLDQDRGGQIHFYHHQLQEYFAARHLLADWQTAEPLAGFWRQPVTPKEMPKVGQLEPFEPLPPPPPTGWEEPTLVAVGLAVDPVAFLEAVRQHNPVLAARCLLEPGLPALPDAKQTVQQDLLARMRDPQAQRRARIAAGEALGRLGDPRFSELRSGKTRFLLPAYVHIPAGKLRMGSAWCQRLRFGLDVARFLQDESPVHQVSVPAFFMACYPVTNAEFACFVEAGGYETDHWWPSENARAWRRGDLQGKPPQDMVNVFAALRQNPASILTTLRQSGATSDQLKVYEAISKMSAEQVQDLINQQYVRPRRMAPAYWDVERYNNPSQPVVGVTWYESLAYCAWLNEQLFEKWDQVDGLNDSQRALWQPLAQANWRIGLPTEPEWEQAARQRGHGDWPWGSRFSAEHANTVEGQVNRPTPVGCYPLGNIQNTLEEMAGNVLEWTRSLYKPYPYNAGNGCEDLASDAHRTLRGGSWNSDFRSARCAFRLRNLPDYFNSNIGFRCVVSLAISES